MLGPRQRLQPRLFYTSFNLEERLAPDHPLRAIAAAVDFDFVRAAVADRYGRRGHESVDPVVLLKLMFLLFHEKVRSERALAAQLPLRLDWMWFCGYDLPDRLPNYSVLSKARQRWGPGVFAGFFQRVLQQCLTAGLVDGRVVHVDGSVIEADADQDCLQVTLRAVGQDLYQRLDEAEASAAAAVAPAPPRGARALPVSPVSASTPAEPTAPVLAAATPSVGPAVGATTSVPAAPIPPSAPAVVPRPAAPPSALPPVGRATPGHEPAPGVWTSPADPDARLTRKQGRTYLGYKDHRVVDDRYGIITATLTTDAAVAEPHLLTQALAAHEFHTGIRAQTPVADKAYGTMANYQDLRERGQTPCIPHPATREDPDMFPRASFIYDPAGDSYCCPAGQTLTRRGPASEERYRYQTAPGTCAACPLRAQCTHGQKGRLLSRHLGQEAMDWADQCGSRAERRVLMRRRKIRVEGSFADATNQHGYKRSRWRGLGRVTIQNLLIATIQNLRKLLRHRPRRSAGPIQVLPAAADALPVALGPHLARSRSMCRRPAHTHTTWTVADPQLN